MKRLAYAVTAAAIGCIPEAARAQWAGATYGAYNATPPTLNSGAFAPLQLDQSGNMKVDCVLGCGGGGGAAASQGTPAAVGNAWPFYPVQGGSAVAAANPLFIQDPLDGTAITAGAALPAGGAGIIGWLSAMYKLQTGTLNVGGTVSISGNVAVTDSAVASALAAPLRTVPFGVTGAPTVGNGAITAAATVLAAEATNVNRLHMTVLNFAGAGGASLYCTDDGSAPTATNASFIVYAQGFYERDAPSWVPSAAIACMSSGGSIPYRAESYP